MAPPLAFSLQIFLLRQDGTPFTNAERPGPLEVTIVHYKSNDTQQSSPIRPLWFPGFGFHSNGLENWLHPRPGGGLWPAEGERIVNETRTLTVDGTGAANLRIRPAADDRRLQIVVCALLLASFPSRGDLGTREAEVRMSGERLRARKDLFPFASASGRSIVLSLSDQELPVSARSFDVSVAADSALRGMKAFVWV